ncbi:hypothetical protein LOTGIDRAFT_231004 [Lottia gigantea]|uniref:Deltamethrin resistance protein prag01 domain-containing protein n=1 Tax=Lottia gigantea TaxID=225164 RepID=V4A7Y2_LOTGI|nr:hypothetical protein LOTGIDRAFT_231004 [Lottia gigantea]ESP00079.1 hypothetical protein LOTGIDRAFT_231004 [Lottia gigantea]
MMLSRAIPRATSLLPRAVSTISLRHGSAGGKSDLEILVESKRHMDFRPIPTKAWSETYNEAQKVMNTKLYLSIAAIIVVSIASYKLDVFLVAPFMFKNSDLILTEDMKLNNYDEEE